MRPVAVEPVKEMTRIRGSSISAVPAAAPPGSTCSSPSGSPASSKTLAWMKPPAIGVRTSGLSTTALPSASAGATERVGRINGTLKGEMTPPAPPQDVPQRTGRERGCLVALLRGDADGELRQASDGTGLPDHPALDLS